YRFEYGRALLERGKPVGAEVQLERALALQPGSAAVLHLLGMARLARARPRDAEGFLRRATQADPERRSYRMQHVRVLMKLRRFAEAGRITAELAASAPDDEEAQAMLKACREMLDRTMGASLGDGAEDRRAGGLFGRLAARV